MPSTLFRTFLGFFNGFCVGIQIVFHAFTVFLHTCFVFRVEGVAVVVFDGGACGANEWARSVFRARIPAAEAVLDGGQYRADFIQAGTRAGVAFG